MTTTERQELYETIIDDMNCGTYMLTPQYVDELIRKYTKIYRNKLRRIKRAVKNID